MCINSCGHICVIRALSARLCYSCATFDKNTIDHYNNRSPFLQGGGNEKETGSNCQHIGIYCFNPYYCSN